MKTDDALRRKLAERLDGFEAEPEPESWTVIKNRIHPKRKRRAIWWWFGGAGCLLLLLWGLNIPQHPAPAEQLSDGLKPASGYAASGAADSPKPLVTATENIKQPATKWIKVDQPATALNTVEKPSGLQEKGLPLSLQQQTEEPGFAGKEAAISAIPIRELNPATAPASPPTLLPSLELLTGKQINPLTILDNPIPPMRVADETPLKTPRRKGGFYASAGLVSTYQLMYPQAQGPTNAANIRLLPAIDTRRLGTSWSAGYQWFLPRGMDVNVGAVWMNLPYRAAYDVVNNTEVQVEFQSGGKYAVIPSVTKVVSEEKRHNRFGLQVEYGYTLKVFRQKFRLFAGADGLFQTTERRPELWAHTGFEIPLRNPHYRLGPSFSYQFKPRTQPDLLLKTRLYGFGLSLKRNF